MRRLAVSAIFLLAAFAPGCKKKQPVQYVEEGGGQLATAVSVADPKASIQLIRGFHDVEGNAWRWTMSKFAFALRPPRESSGAGVKLFLELVIPEVFTQKIPETKLMATIDGKPLEPQVYNKPGSYRYERDVPPEMLKGDVVSVEFTLDRFLASGTVESRELGVIVSAAGLQAIAPK